MYVHSAYNCGCIYFFDCLVSVDFKESAYFHLIDFLHQLFPEFGADFVAYYSSGSVLCENCIMCLF
jgi:hypothetical protein